MLQKALVNRKRRAPLTNKVQGGSVFLCSLFCSHSLSPLMGPTDPPFRVTHYTDALGPFLTMFVPTITAAIIEPVRAVGLFPIPVKLPISHERREITRGSLKWKWSLSLSTVFPRLRQANRPLHQCRGFSFPETNVAPLPSRDELFKSRWYGFI